MKVDIEGVDQRLLFSGKGKVQNWLVIALPTGERIRALVGDDGLNSLLGSVGSEFDEQEASAGVEMEQEFQAPTFEAMRVPEGVPQPTDVPPVTFEDFVGAEQPAVGEAPSSPEQNISWEELDEDILPESMKAAMRAAMIKPVLSTSALIRVTDEIAERMMAEATLSQPPQATRTRVMNAVPPRRTVPTTEYGYPKVAGMDNDPGELGAEADEDGVSQL